MKQEGYYLVREDYDDGEDYFGRWVIWHQEDYNIVMAERSAGRHVEWFNGIHENAKKECLRLEKEKYHDEEIEADYVMICGDYFDLDN